MSASVSPTGGDAHGFHAYLDAVNARRLLPLIITVMVLLGIAALNNVFVRGTFDPTESNFLGLLLGIAQLPLLWWSSSMRVKANVFGLTIVGWGITSASIYADAVFARNAGPAAGALVAYFVTRVLAALTMLWRPWDLALILLVGYAASAPVIGRANFANAYVLTPIWTFVAWLAAFLIYRAQRDAFFARAVLQEQRDALAKANVRLEQLNQEKNDLMAIAAHDLRSPLMGMATLLNLTASEAARVWSAGVDRLKTVERSCHEMADLVSRVLDLHAAEDQLGQLSLTVSDVQPVVVGAVEAHRTRASAKSIALTLEAIPGPYVAVHDAQALTRVIDNLVSNAVKFSPSGGAVHVRLTRNGAGATIAVSDSGPGISAEERSRLFRKFARLRARPTGNESSSGLGLYITKRLTDAMGGSIVVADATPGATFVVNLRAPST